MLNIQRAISNDRILRSLTGLSVKQFHKLASTFGKTLAQDRAAARKRCTMQRSAGAGRPHRLASDTDKLFFILLYLRIYPTMQVAAFLLETSPPAICEWVHRLLPILERTLGKRQELPQRKIRSLEEFLTKFPEVERVLLDSTERPRTRPKDPKEQKRHYSGKKKRHTLKNTLVVAVPGKRIIVVGSTVAGPTHDKEDSRQIVEYIPEQIPIAADLGYKGLENEFVEIYLPIKKPRKGELTEEQKQKNREFSRERVVIEHRIGHVKRYRCVSEIYRNRRAGFADDLMVVCCGLSNYYQRTQSPLVG